MTMLSFGEIAPIRRRVVAYILDALIAAAIPLLGVILSVVLIIGSARGGDAASGLVIVGLIVAPAIGALALAWFIVFTIMQAGRGSIGMRAQGLRLADASTGARIGFGRALLRNIVFGLAGAIVVGVFSPLFDGSGRFQGWHDKVAGALMLDARGSVPAGSADAATAHDIAQPEPAERAAERHPQATAWPAELSAPAESPTAAVLPAPSEPPEQTVVAARAHEGLPGDPLISFVPGVTRPPEQSSARAPQPATPTVVASATPAPAPASMTSAPTSEPSSATGTADADDDIESTRISVPGHRLIFTWDDGQRVPVSGRTVFGRNPEREPGAVVVSVRDETLSLSKTHFEARAEPTGGWIMDRQSTNGTTVVRDGARIACPPGQRVPVRLGDAIEIGDRIVTIGGFA